mmetsp:Transcript_16570/g.14940  ORF Transcript_16570/g.14940 Transcript_16570/m.14940 type:complete len:426 (+) Transcript_16570:28-1305(+)
MSIRNNEFMNITITDPVKLSDKFGSYISYKINTVTNRPGLVQDRFVTRRFSDFVWLSKELSRIFPGIILPALPEKQTVGRFSTEFVEARLRGLERFLQKISNHNEINKSEQFVLFIQADDSSFTKAVEDSKASKPKLPSTAMKWFEGTVNSIQNSGKAEIERTAADDQVDDMQAYILSLERQMTSISKNAEIWVRKCRESSLAMLDLGQSFTNLTSTDSDLLGQNISELGKTIEQVSTLSNSHAEAQGMHTEEPFDEYVRDIISVRNAIQQRQDKRSAYADALTDVQVKQNAYKKLSGVSGKEDQANQKQQLVVKAQAIADSAKLEYDQVSERLLREFELFKYQKAIDLKNILSKFIENQMNYYRKAEESWLSFSPDAVRLSVTPANIRFDDDFPSAPLFSPPPPVPNPNEYTSFPHDVDDMIGV